MTWESINFFDNPFSADVGDILFGKPPSGEIDLSSPDNSSDGVLRKKWTIVEDHRMLVKSGTEPFYQEPYNEAIASIIMNSQGISNANYRLTSDEDIPCSICEDFIDRDTELITAGQIVSQIGCPPGVSKRDLYESFCSDIGLNITDHMAKQDFIDHIMMNTDRHLGNYELIRDANALEWIGAAPIYDTGTSLMCKATTRRIIESIPNVNDDLKMDGRILHADLDWLDIEGMFNTLPTIEEILCDGSSEYRMEDDRITTLMALLRKRMEGVEEMLL